MHSDHNQHLDNDDDVYFPEKQRIILEHTCTLTNVSKKKKQINNYME